MSFSYSEPNNGVFPTKKDEVRFLLMDTIETEFSLSDQEIAYLLVQFDDKVYLASSQGALHLAVAYAQLAAVTSKSVGDLSLSLSYQNTSDEYKALAQRLRMGIIDNTLAVYYAQADTEMVFEIGQFDDHRP